MLLLHSLTWIGLEFHSDSIRVLQLTSQKGSYKTVSQTSAPLAKGAIIAGRILQPTHVTEVLQTLFSSITGKIAKVVLAIPSHAVIRQQISLPPYLQQNECQIAINANLTHYFPGINERLHVDFVVEEVQETYQAITLIAARQAQLEQYKMLVTQVGFTIGMIDLIEQALLRAVNYCQALAGLGTEPIIIIEAFDHSTQVMIYDQQKMVYSQLWPQRLDVIAIELLKNIQRICQQQDLLFRHIFYLGKETTSLKYFHPFKLILLRDLLHSIFPDPTQIWLSTFGLALRGCLRA